jgi:hypothetical protein
LFQAGTYALYECCEYKQTVTLYTLIHIECLYHSFQRITGRHSLQQQPLPKCSVHVVPCDNKPVPLPPRLDDLGDGGDEVLEEAEAEELSILGEDENLLAFCNSINDPTDEATLPYPYESDPGPEAKEAEEDESGFVDVEELDLTPEVVVGNRSLLAELSAFLDMDTSPEDL